MDFIHLLSSIYGAPAGARFAHGACTGVRFQPLLSRLQEGHFQGALGVAQWLRASMWDLPLSVGSWEVGRPAGNNSSVEGREARLHEEVAETPPSILF